MEVNEVKKMKLGEVRVALVGILTRCVALKLTQNMLGQLAGITSSHLWVFS